MLLPPWAQRMMSSDLSDLSDITACGSFIRVLHPALSSGCKHKQHVYTHHLAPVWAGPADTDCLFSVFPWWLPSVSTCPPGRRAPIGRWASKPSAAAPTAWRQTRRKSMTRDATHADIAWLWPLTIFLSAGLWRQWEELLPPPPPNQRQQDTWHHDCIDCFGFYDRHGKEHTWRQEPVTCSSSSVCWHLEENEAPQEASVSVKSQRLMAETASRVEDCVGGGALRNETLEIRSQIKCFNYMFLGSPDSPARSLCWLRPYQDPPPVSLPLSVSPW